MSADHTKLAYSIADLAHVAGVGRSFIYEEIRQGRLKVKKAGRRTLVLQSEATHWLDALPELYVSSHRRAC